MAGRMASCFNIYSYFLISRIQFLISRIHFLIPRIHFLISRIHFLISRIQFVDIENSGAARYSEGSLIRRFVIPKVR